MRGINASAQVSGPFLLLYFGAALLSIAAGVSAVIAWRPGSGWVLAGALLGLVGAIVTAAVNVPLNDQLAAAEVTGSTAQALWDGYLRDWTAWNHVRAVSGVLGAALMAVGIAHR
jgi:uncharacterized membrane protein